MWLVTKIPGQFFLQPGGQNWWFSLHSIQGKKGFFFFFFWALSHTHTHTQVSVSLVVGIRSSLALNQRDWTMRPASSGETRPAARPSSLNSCLDQLSQTSLNFAGTHVVTCHHGARNTSSEWSAFIGEYVSVGVMVFVCILPHKTLQGYLYVSQFSVMVVRSQCILYY